MVAAEAETEACSDTPTDPSHRALVSLRKGGVHPPLNLTRGALLAWPGSLWSGRSSEPGDWEVVSVDAVAGGRAQRDQGSWRSGGMEAPASWALLRPLVGRSVVPTRRAVSPSFLHGREGGPGPHLPALSVSCRTSDEKC